MRQIRPPLARRTYRVAEVVQSTGVPKATIYRWIAEGLLPAIRVNRVILIPARALDALLNEKR